MADLDGRYTANNSPPKIMMFPELIVPVEGKDDRGEPTGKKAWKVEFLMNLADPDLAGLFKLAGQFYNEAFPGRWNDAKAAAKEAGSLSYPAVFGALSRAGTNTPFFDGSTRADVLAEKGKKYGEAYRGKFVLVASKPELKRDGSPISPPALSGIERGGVVDYNTPETKALAAPKFFSGAECFFEVMLASYTAGKGGVKAYINMVFATGKGTRVAGGPSGAEKFGMHVGQVSAVNPVDEDISF